MNKLKFKIEQIAIAPHNSEKAIGLLKAIGAEDWTKDIVVAEGDVFGQKAYKKINVAELNFNYQIGKIDADKDGIEFEVLDYQAGDNWLDYGNRLNSVSHLGMHCTDEELVEWKELFNRLDIKIAQEVDTVSHSNEYLIDKKRKYHYCIFDTKEILGADLKFIVRKENV